MGEWVENFASLDVLSHSITPNFFINPLKSLLSPSKKGENVSIPLPHRGFLPPQLDFGLLPESIHHYVAIGWPLGACRR